VAGLENTFIQSVHRHLPPSPPPVATMATWPAEVLYRMKNHNQYNSGIADVWYDCDPRRQGQDLWVEYKYVVIPKRDETLIVPGLSPLQFDWLTARLRAGRNVTVIVGCKEGGVCLLTDQWEGLPTKVFRKQLQTRQDLARYIKTLVNS
jgi:hypothetical protein